MNIYNKRSLCSEVNAAHRLASIPLGGAVKLTSASAARLKIDSIPLLVYGTSGHATATGGRLVCFRNDPTAQRPASDNELETLAAHLSADCQHPTLPTPIAEQSRHLSPVARLTHD